MFVLIWVTVFLSVRNNDADKGPSVWGGEHCQLPDYCVTFKDAAVTAEAGLCAVIPCSFKSPVIPQKIIWYKCEHSKEKCEESDRVFTSSMTSRNVQPEFKGRVSLLEPDLGQKNCSIVINDLRVSDSGSYQLRVEGDGKNKLTFTVAKAILSVTTGLNQKSRLMIPPLTEGQQTTLTCAAPGFCSGSPKFTWTWREKGEKDFNITDSHNENLTFTPSARHHGINITCRISFTGDVTTEETVTLNVTYVKKVKISGNPRVKEGETLNLTCSVESFPPSFITWTKSKTDSNLQNDSLPKESGFSSLLIPNATAENSGLYICTVAHLNNTFRKEINASVTYTRKPQITGSPSVKEGEDLNLTCSSDSFPPSVISWTKSGEQIHKNHALNETENGTEIFQQDGPGIGSLSIISITAGDAGLYICTAEHLNTTMTEGINVTVVYARKPQITGNKVVKEGEDLNLTCSSDSFPPSVISWTKSGNTTNLQSNNSSKTQNGIGIFQQDRPGIGSFSIINITAGDAGLYICTAEHLDGNVTVSADVTVTWFSQILTGSGCFRQSEGLTCVCISEGFPLPSIQWPLLKNHTEYSVTTTVSNHTVNSTVTIRHHGNSRVECFSSNENGEAAENLVIQSFKPGVIKADKHQHCQDFSLKVVAAFLFGGLLSAVICCLALKYYRKKQKKAGNLDEAEEMITVDPSIYSSRAVKADWSKVQEAADNGAAAAENEVPGFKGGPKEPVYASIDFSSWRPRAAAIRQDSRETEYAQIKTKSKMEDDSVEVITEEDSETKDFVQVEECSDEAVYSSVKDLADGT